MGLITVPDRPRLWKPPYAEVDWDDSLSFGLIGCWLMNEGGGQKVFDLSGNSNTGSLVADTHFVPGKFGSALSFDGIGDYIDIPNYDLSANWTISIWAKVTVEGTNPYDSMLLGNGGDDDNFFYIWSGTRARFENSAGANVSWDSDTGFQNRWRHYVLVANSTHVNLYLDGISQGEQTITPTFKFYHIAFAHSETPIFTGQIDHVMIFNCALSASEIARLYIHPFRMLTVPRERALFANKVSVPPTGNPWNYYAQC